jgi:hypothetical protein
LECLTGSSKVLATRKVVGVFAYVFQCALHPAFEQPFFDERITILTDAVPNSNKTIDLAVIDLIVNKEITLVVDESHSLGV